MQLTQVGGAGSPPQGVAGALAAVPRSASAPLARWQCMKRTWGLHGKQRRQSQSRLLCVCVGGVSMCASDAVGL